MRILVTGAHGMLGRDVVAAQREQDDVRGVDIDDGDLTDKQTASDLIAESKPDWVINCAAYTAVDKAETEPDLARAVNVDLVANLAEACRTQGARLLHVSTDYVFSGNKCEPYLPSDKPDPLGVYGRSKFEGEQAAQKVLGKDVAIVRTAWLYGPHGPSFVKAILAQIDRDKPLHVVDDQIGPPTYTGHLAEALWAAVHADLRGVHHAVNTGYCSWYAFAVAICELSGHAGLPVAPMSSSELDRPAPRPADSRLDTSSFTAATGHLLPLWREGLTAYLKRIDRYAP